MDAVTSTLLSSLGLSAYRNNIDKVLSMSGGNAQVLEKTEYILPDRFIVFINDGGSTAKSTPAGPGHLQSGRVLSPSGFYDLARQLKRSASSIPPTSPRGAGEVVSPI